MPRKAISLINIPPLISPRDYPTSSYSIYPDENKKVLASDSSTESGFNWQYVPNWSQTSSSLTGIKTLQFVSGTILSPVLTGAVEYDGTDLFYTNNNGTRNNITSRPYISAFDTGSHTAASTTVAYALTCSNVAASNDIYRSNHSRFYVNHSFTYSISFSIQFINTNNNVVHDAYAWLAVTGTNVDNTNTYVSIPGAHSGVDGASVMMVNLFQYLASGSYFEIYWAANSTHVSVQTIASASSPTRPAAPGVILTVSRIND